MIIHLKFQFTYKILYNYKNLMIIFHKRVNIFDIHEKDEAPVRPKKTQIFEKKYFTKYFARIMNIIFVL